MFGSYHFLLQGVTMPQFGTARPEKTDLMRLSRSIAYAQAWRNFTLRNHFNLTGSTQGLPVFVSTLVFSLNQKKSVSMPMPGSSNWNLPLADSVLKWSYSLA